jgi:hypothetical protein
MPMRKVPVAWQTGVGGVGVSVFYTPFGTDATVELATFFNAIKTQVPSVVTWDVPGTGDVVDEASGLITGAWIGGTPATVVATGAAIYAGGTGAYVKWQTGGIVAGRRVRGRTFLCPIINTGYDAQGTIGSGTLAVFGPAATTLAGSGKLLIWHRPSGPGATDGSSHAVVGASVPDKVTSLRSRRT